MGASWFSVDSFKDGVPDDDVLEELSVELGNYWEPVVQRLKFKNAEGIVIHKDNEEYAKKALKTLFHWKKRDASKATYRVLDTACLTNCLKRRRDLAEKFCC